MGCKDKKIVYDEDEGGTKDVKVDENEVFRWALSLAQAEEVARGVRNISRAYGGMIMDTEFCIDSADRLWFVQARPETRWNEDFHVHPNTIFMRRKEVDPKALADAELILEGNGASRGAGQGVVKFLRSALELNKVNKGDILADEPVASLDPATTLSVMNDFTRINKMGITIIANMHHVDLAKKFSTRIIGIRGGRIVFDGKPEEIDEEVTIRIYGRALNMNEKLGNIDDKSISHEHETKEEKR